MSRMTQIVTFAFWILVVLHSTLGAQKSRWEELNARVERWIENREYAKAIPVAEEALRAAETSFGLSDSRVGTAAHNLAVLYHMQGKSEEAEKLLGRALKVRQAALGTEHLDVSITLSALADLYEGQSRYGEAEALYRRALEDLEKGLGPRNTRTANLLSSLGALYYNQGKYSEAESSLRRAGAIHEEKLGPDHPDVATALNDLAVVLRALNRYAEAESLHRRALSIRENRLGADHPDVATSLNNIVILYEDQGRYREAVSLQQRALAIREKVLGRDHPDVADSLENLAGLFELQGRYLDAESLHQRSLAIREKKLGPGHDDVSNSLNSLATLLDRQGKHVEAERLLQRAISIREKTLGPKHPRFALLLQNLASIYQDVGRYDDAASLHRRALSIFEETLGLEHPRVAGSLNNLAAMYVNEGRLDEAEPLFRRALAIREKRLGTNHPAVAGSLHNLAGLYRRVGKYDEAQDLLRRAVAIYEKVMGSEDPRVATHLNGLALTYYAQGNTREASRLFQQTQQHLRSQVETEFTYMTEQERLSFLDTLADTFPAFLSFCLTHGNRDPLLAEQMYDFLLWKKGLIATGITALRAQIERTRDQVALALFDKLTDARNAISQLRSAQTTDPAQRRKTLAALEEGAHALERELVTRSTAVAQEKRLLRVTWRDVQKALKAREAAVELVRVQVHDGRSFTGGVRYVALMLTPTAPRPRVIELGSGELLERSALAEYRVHVASTRGLTAKPTSTSGGAAMLWQPLEAALASARRVYLSPDGLLHHVAWGVLPRGDGRLVLEVHDLRVVSSTKDLVRPRSPTPASRAVLFGNPAFDLTEAEQQRAARTIERPGGTRAAIDREEPRRQSRRLTGASVDPLPGTEKEVERIAGLLRARRWQVELFKGAHALEERVKQITSPRVLHIATHGVFRPDPERGASRRAGPPKSIEDPMLRSGLLFAGANRALGASAFDDGELTAYEATGLNLQGTELVVLSACETALGAIKNGEGVFGLRRALEVAGAQAILMSLWDVPDVETQELMTRFYQHWLSGLEKPAALRRAQLEMRKVVKARHGRDLPYYWGAFVLVGR